MYVLGMYVCMYVCVCNVCNVAGGKGGAYVRVRARVCVCVCVCVCVRA